MIVECPKPLLSLLRSCAGIDRLVGRGEDLPPFDVQAPLLEPARRIPHLPGNDTLPMFPTSLLTPAWSNTGERELGRIAGFKIGIAWRGTKHRNDRTRSIPLAASSRWPACPVSTCLACKKGRARSSCKSCAAAFRLPTWAAAWTTSWTRRPCCEIWTW